MLQSLLVVRDLKNTVGECKVGVCKLGCAGKLGCASWGVQVGECKIGCWLCRHALRSRSASWGVQVGVCKLGCALGIHDDKCVVFSVASYSVLVGQMPLVSYGM